MAIVHGEYQLMIAGGRTQSTLPTNVYTLIETAGACCLSAWPMSSLPLFTPVFQPVPLPAAALDVSLPVGTHVVSSGAWRSLYKAVNTVTLAGDHFNYLSLPLQPLLSRGQSNVSSLKFAGKWSSGGPAATP